MTHFYTINLVVTLLLFTVNAMRIGLVVEDSAVSSNVIERIVKRYVQSYRVIGMDTFHLEKMAVTDATRAVFAVCGHTNLMALVAIASCSTLHQLALLGKSLRLPTILIPIANICWTMPYSAFVYHGRIQPNVYGESVVAILKNEGLSHFVLIATDITESLQTESLIYGLSKETFAFISFPYSSSVTAADLKSLSEEEHLVIFLEKELLLDLIDKAKSAGLLTDFYHWIVVLDGLSLNTLIGKLPPNARVVTVKESVQMRGGHGCADHVKWLYSNCNEFLIKETDVRVRDAIISVAMAVKKSGRASTFWSCDGPSTSKAGYPVQRELNAVNINHTILGHIGFNSAHHLQRQITEVWSTSTIKSKLTFSHMIVIKNSKDRQKLRRRTMELFPDIVHNFYGRDLWICTVKKPQVAMPTGKVNADGSVEYEGLLKIAVDFLSSKKALNFKPKVKFMDSEGIPQSNSTYFTGCIGGVQRGLFDMAGGAFHPVPESKEVVDSTHPIVEEPHAILLRRPRPPNPMWNVFKPLRTSVWTAIVIASIVCATVSWLFSVLSPFSVWNLNTFYAVSAEVKWSEHLWNIFGAILQQGQEFYPSTTSARCVLSFWWFFTVIIMASFTGDLTSFLAVADVPKGYESLDEYVRDSRITLIIGNDSRLVYAIKHVSVFKKSKFNRYVIGDEKKCLEQIVHDEDIACAASLSTVRQKSLTNCDILYEIPETFELTSVGFLVQKGSFLKEAMDKQFQYVKEIGLANQWRHRFLGKPCEPPKMEVAATSIKFSGASGVFVFTSIIYLCGFSILIVELFFVSREHRIIYAEN